MDFIPYGRQHITNEDIQNVVRVLKSDFITQGPEVKAFEEAIAKKVGAKYSLAVNSATSALHIAIKAMGVGSGDYVWTSPITFVASSNCALYEGAKVDFVDIDPVTYNFSYDAFCRKLEEAKKEGKVPKVIIPVHFSGQSCEMEKISALCREYGVKIIEDASHAIGAKYKDSYVGNCKYSDVTVFSFHPVKIVTTGEGGVALTNSPDIFTKMELYRSHGVTRDLNLINNKNEGAWYYEQVGLGYNYRITDIQAALGLSQLNRLDEYILKRHEISLRYKELLEGFPLILPSEIEDSYSAYHLYVVQIDKSRSSVRRREVFDFMRSKNIGVNVHYIPVHTQPYYQSIGFEKGMFPISENFYDSALSLPMFPTLTEDEQIYVCETLKEALND
ncbi:MAG: UDP-4-amino-4,6-dideoxy-N-acetyl-beta-L-altrosamine transaminase [Halobacteriovoraceae bacterium]|nr:UDP-4-amino-4,6-dideoxy-N-acetyl-beta-L-altrosamine transaminase [Halobacteriovoraceae bacterium]